MNRHKVCGPSWLVEQPPCRVITFAYDLRFGRSIARWKVLSKIYNFWLIKYVLMATIWPRISKKRRLRPQNGPESLGLEKLQKNNQETATMDNCFEPVEQVGGHRYPSRSFFTHTTNDSISMWSNFNFGIETRTRSIMNNLI